MKTQEPSLLILAAGMGSRYGGLKQMDVFGPSGETIIDFSIYDAIRAGFKKLVFVIRKSFADEFIQRMETRWKHKIEMNFVFQEIENLPDGIEFNAERTKPWGTGHAVWVAKNVINENFGVINADDFYGKEAMQLLYNFLVEENNYAVIAYLLNNTLSEHGAVNRGVCEVDSKGYLSKIKETKNIHSGDEIFYIQNDEKQFLSPDTLVSMNMWAFRPDYFGKAENYFSNFIQQHAANPSAEFYIPELIQYLIDEENLKVSVLHSESKWIGVTYKEDKSFVESAFKEMIMQGTYPAQI